MIWHGIYTYKSLALDNVSKFNGWINYNFKFYTESTRMKISDSWTTVVSTINVGLGHQVWFSIWWDLRYDISAGVLVWIGYRSAFIHQTHDISPPEKMRWFLRLFTNDSSNARKHKDQKVYISCACFHMHDIIEFVLAVMSCVAIEIGR